MSTDILKPSNRKNALIFAILLSTAVLVILIMLSDSENYITPRWDEYWLFIYTSIGLAITLTPIIMTGWHDRARFPTETGFRHMIKVIFGALWILDGVLQLQPEMSYGFLSSVIIPVVSALPALIQPFFIGIVSEWAHFPILFDAISAIVQITIGVGLLLVRRKLLLKSVLLLSIAWGTIVWVLGEGLGGTLSVGASYLSGFPGSALIYVMVAAVLLLDVTDEVAIRIMSAFLFYLFLLSAIVQALPLNTYWSGSALSSLPGGMASNIQPIFIQQMISAFSAVLLAFPFVWNAAIVAAFLIISASWIRSARTAAWITAAVSLFIWVFFQDFGIIGGYGTDPNTALPVMLISVSIILFFRSTVKQIVSQSKKESAMRDSGSIQQ
ncbi:MAG: hypothetical protein ACYCT2_03595 [Thermoplasmataceae archaeon]